MGFPLCSPISRLYNVSRAGDILGAKPDFPNDQRRRVVSTKEPVMVSFRFQGINTEQALFRIIGFLLISAYSIGIAYWKQESLVSVCFLSLFALLVAFGEAILVKRRGMPSGSGIRIAFLLVDIGLIMAFITALGNGAEGSPLFVALLWVPYDYSYRYGSMVMYTAILSTSLYLVVLGFTASYWKEHWILLVSVIIALVSLSFYVQRLIRTLEKARAEKQGIAEETKEQKEEIIAMLHSLSEGVLLFTAAGMIKAMNAEAERLLGVDPLENYPEQVSVRDIYIPRHRFTKEVLEDHPLKRLASNGYRACETRKVMFTSKDHKELLLEETVSVVHGEGGEFRGGVLVIRDVTDREMQEKIRREREQLRILAVHLQNAREEERAAVSREVHDELGNMLAAIGFDIAALKDLIPSGMEEASNMLKRLSTNVTTTSQVVKQVVGKLRPYMIELGISAAIEWYTRDFETRTGIHCELSLPDMDAPLDKERSTALFRIFQEAMTNVAKHAEASRVCINLCTDNNLVRLTIKDDGIGLNPEYIDKPKPLSYGILGMTERAAHLQGSIRIGVPEEGGTMVGIVIPIDVPDKSPA